MHVRMHTLSKNALVNILLNGITTQGTNFI
jgi:hypothetical protein